MQVSGKLHAQTALPAMERAPGIHWIGNWERNRRSLDSSRRKVKNPHSSWAPPRYIPNIFFVAPIKTWHNYMDFGAYAIQNYKSLLSYQLHRFPETVEMENKPTAVKGNRFMEITWRSARPQLRRQFEALRTSSKIHSVPNGVLLVLCARKLPSFMYIWPCTDMWSRVAAINKFLVKSV